MSTITIIKQITIADIPKIEILQRLSYDSYYCESGDIFKQMINVFPTGAWGVFLENQQLAGYIFFHPYLKDLVKPVHTMLYLSGNEDCMYLHDVNISPQHRGLGVANILLSKYDEKTLLHGYNVQCLVAVQKSRPYWEKKGFFPSYEVNCDGYSAALYMQKHIIHNEV